MQLYQQEGFAPIPPVPQQLVSTLIRIAAWVGARTCFDNNDLPSPSLLAPTVLLAFDYWMTSAHLQLLLFVRTRPLLTLVTWHRLSTKYLIFGSNYVIDKRTNVRLMLLSLILESSGGHDRVRKSENFPDSKIFVAKTFRMKRVNCIIFQIRDKYA